MKLFWALLFVQSLFFFQCVTTAKIPVVESAPPDFYEKMKGTRTIGIFVDDRPESLTDNWKGSIHAGIESALSEYNYFKIVDIKNRSQRLKEMGFAMQMGNEIRSLGTELSIQGLLYVEIPEPPKFDCKLSSSSRSETFCVAKNKEGKCIKQATREVITFEQTLTYIVFAKAKLINIGSGQTLIATNTEPAILRNSAKTPAVACPSITEAHSKAVKIASDQIARVLSPKVSPYSVPFFNNSIGVEDDSKTSEVEALLKSGITWVDSDSPNFEFAKKDWEKAVSRSNNSSANAFWNLAVYYWQSGDIPNAEVYFNKAIFVGGPDLLDSSLENFRLMFRNKRRDVINKFYEEKKRFELENKQAKGNLKNFLKELVYGS